MANDIAFDNEMLAPDLSHFSNVLNIMIYIDPNEEMDVFVPSGPKILIPCAIQNYHFDKVCKCIHFYFCCVRIRNKCTCIYNSTNSLREDNNFVSSASPVS